MEKEIYSVWNQDNQLLTTRIGGNVNIQDVKRWSEGLHNTVNEIPDNSGFKIFVNLHGFTALDTEAHKAFRTVIPLLLARHGWKAGYTGLFEEEAAGMRITEERGVRCLAAAHCHHDAGKMEMYEARFAHDREHYFTNPDMAAMWIGSLQTNWGKVI